MGNLNTNHRVKARYKTQSGHKTWTLSNILYLYDQIISLYLVGPKIETMNLIITVVNCPVNFNLINIICTFGLNSPWRLFVLSGRLITSLQNISGLQLVNIMHFKQAFFLFQSICSYRLMTWVFGFLWSCSKLLKLWLLEYTVCFCWLTPIKVKMGEWNWLNWIFFNCIYLLLVNWEVDFNMHNKKKQIHSCWTVEIRCYFIPYLQHCLWQREFGHHISDKTVLHKKCFPVIYSFDLYSKPHIK